MMHGQRNIKLNEGSPCCCEHHVKCFDVTVHCNECDMVSWSLEVGDDDVAAD